MKLHRNARAEARRLTRIKTVVDDDEETDSKNERNSSDLSEEDGEKDDEDEEEWENVSVEEEDEKVIKETENRSRKIRQRGMPIRKRLQEQSSAFTSLKRQKSSQNVYPRKVRMITSSDEDVDTNESQEETKSRAQSTPNSGRLNQQRFEKSPLNSMSTNSRSNLKRETQSRPTEVPYCDITGKIEAAVRENALLETLTLVFDNLLKENEQPSRVLCIGILCAVKEHSEHFGSPEIIKYLIRLLRSKNYLKGSSGNESLAKTLSKKSSFAGGSSFQSISKSAKSGKDEAKGDIIPVPVLVSNILMDILKDKHEWPEDTIRVYLDDALYSRAWVDHECSRHFVTNIKSLMDFTHPNPNSNPSAIYRKRFHTPEVVQSMKDLITQHIQSRMAELDKERPGSGHGPNNWTAARNLILTLIDFVSIAPLRIMCTLKMEQWLQNSALKTLAKDLLNKIVEQCSTTEHHDLETVDGILKIRWKPTMFQFRVEILTQLVRHHSLFLRRALSVLIARERACNIGTDADNSKLLQHIFRATKVATATECDFYTTPFQHSHTTATKELAHVLRELAGTSDYAPVIKTILRRVLKQLGFDVVDLKTLCTEMLVNDNHWETLTRFGDLRLPDHMSFITGLVWLVLLMRGAAVKSLEIQFAATSNAHSVRHTASNANQIIASGTYSSRRLASSVHGRTNHLAKAGALHISAPQASSKIPNAMHAIRHAGTSPPSIPRQPSKAFPQATNAPNTCASESVKIAFRAKEELSQALAHVQRQSVFCCREIFNHFQLDGASSFERILYEAIVKKLLFLEIPSDMQSTEHDKTCFESIKEGIPLHKETIPSLVDLWCFTTNIDRFEALEILSIITFRAAKDQMLREQVWKSLDKLNSYAENGGVIGIEMDSVDCIESLFSLTKIQSNVNSISPLPALCDSKRFWMLCSVLLVIGCFNPTTIGQYLWQNVPTLRALMHMVISDRFMYPPVLAHDPLLVAGKNSSKLHASNMSLMQIVGDLQAQEDQICQLEGVHVMILDVFGVARKPSSEFLESLKILNTEYTLGDRLRQSRQYDFFTEMVSGAFTTHSHDMEDIWSDTDMHAETQAQIGWIADIVHGKVKVLRHLPVTSLCKLLLLAQKHYSNASGASNLIVSSSDSGQSLERIGPQLLSMLVELIQNPHEDSQACIIRYFLAQLMDSDCASRHVSAQILYQLTQYISQPEEKGTCNDVDQTSLNFFWLPALAQLECFHQISSQLLTSFEYILLNDSCTTSLVRCIRAIHHFWHHRYYATSTNEREAQGECLGYTTRLAHLFGKLANTRRLVMDALMEDASVFEIFASIFSAIIVKQLSSTKEQRAKTSISDCKVIYVTNKSQRIEELKLSVATIHGMMHMLSRWTQYLSLCTLERKACLDFAILQDALFPKPVAPRSGSTHATSITIRASTGLIAAKDPKLSPDLMLREMVTTLITYATKDMDSNGNILHMIQVIIKALSFKSLWILAFHALDKELSAWNALILFRLQNACKESDFELERTLQEAVRETCGCDDWGVGKCAASALSYLHGIHCVPLMQYLEKLADTQQERVAHAIKAESIDWTKVLANSLPSTVVKLDALLETADGMHQNINLAQPKEIVKSPFEVSLESSTRNFLHRNGWEAKTKDTAEALQDFVQTLHGAQGFGQYIVQDVIVEWTKTHCHDTQLLYARFVHNLLSHVRPTIWSAFVKTFTIAFTKFLQNAPANEIGILIVLDTIFGYITSCMEDERMRWDMTANFAQTFLKWLLLMHALHEKLTQASKDLPHLNTAKNALNLLTLLSSANKCLYEENLTVVLYELVHCSFFQYRAWFTAPMESADRVRREGLTILYRNDPLQVSAKMSAIQCDLHALIRLQDEMKLKAWNQNLHSPVAALLDRSIDDIFRHLFIHSDDSVQSSLDLHQKRMQCLTHLVHQHPILIASRLPARISKFYGTITLTQLYLSPDWFEQMMNAFEILYPLLHTCNVLLDPITHVLFEFLQLLVQYQALGFHALVFRVMEYLRGVMTMAKSGAISFALGPEAAYILRNVVTLYAQDERIAAYKEFVDLITENNMREKDTGASNFFSSFDAISQSAFTATVGQHPALLACLQENMEPLQAMDLQSILDALKALVLSKNAHFQKDMLALSPTTISPHDALVRGFSALLLSSILNKELAVSSCHFLLRFLQDQCQSWQQQMTILDLYLDAILCSAFDVKDVLLESSGAFIAYCDRKRSVQLFQLLFEHGSKTSKSILISYFKSFAFATQIKLSTFRMHALEA